MERPTLPTVPSAADGEEARGEQVRGEQAGRQRQAGAPLSPGDTVAGRYVLEEVLGSGGMGVVYAARHATLGHRVACKLISATASADADAFARFSREARIVASLESDHIVRVVDFGMHGAMPYMVMEVLAGRDLGSELQLRKALPVEEAVDYVLQACDGLAVAHASGVVHRDVKLANLFLAMRGDGVRVVKLLDFGVSKLQSPSDDDVNLTRTTAVLGSPTYMSPEQIRDPRAVDARADVWSLGVVLYKLLTDAAPFEGLSANALCAAIAADPPTPLRSRAPHVPPRLEAIVLRCLEKRAEMRYPSVAALALELAAFASPGGGVAAERPSAEPGTKLRHAVLGGLGAILAIAAVAAAVATRGRPTAQASAEPPALATTSAAVDGASGSSAPGAPPSVSSLATPPAPVPAATPGPRASAGAPAATTPAVRTSAQRRRAPGDPAAVAAPVHSAVPAPGFGGSALDDHH